MAKNPEPVLRFALVGCGLIGRKRTTALKGLGAPLLHACDLNGARAADLAASMPGCQPQTDYKVVLADPKVDAVIVSTLNGSLAPLRSTPCARASTC